MVICLYLTFIVTVTDNDDVDADVRWRWKLKPARKWDLFKHKYCVWKAEMQYTNIHLFLSVLWAYENLSNIYFCNLNLKLFLSTMLLNLIGMIRFVVFEASNALTYITIHTHTIHKYCIFKWDQMVVSSLSHWNPLRGWCWLIPRIYKFKYSCGVCE